MEILELKDICSSIGEMKNHDCRKKECSQCYVIWKNALRTKLRSPDDLDCPKERDQTRARDESFICTGMLIPLKAAIEKEFENEERRVIQELEAILEEYFKEYKFFNEDNQENVQLKAGCHDCRFIVYITLINTKIREYIDCAERGNITNMKYKIEDALEQLTGAFLARLRLKYDELFAAVTPSDLR
jgi:hypothetical protein